MIILKDTNYSSNRNEMIINFKNKKFDGEINIAIVDVKFKFGIQCSESSKGLIKEINQEINHEIIWTQYDIEYLLKGVYDILNTSFNDDKQHLFIGLLEQEFEIRCFLYPNNFIELYISVGICAMGSTIRINVSKNQLLNWINEIKEDFYKLN